jgi:hypothetical protein
MKIYLAGKVGYNDWRHTIVSGLRGAATGAYNCLDAPEPEFFDWPVLDSAIFSSHSYVGPYFATCDHGCIHGDNKHGANVTISDGHLDVFDSGTARRLRAACYRAIESADLLFAWIEDVTCYGTLAEIGYATAKKVDVITAGPRPLPDLWFATPNFGVVASPAAALEWAIADATARRIQRLRELGKRDYSAYLRTEHWQKLRQAALERASFRCQLCNGTVNLRAHHRTYETLGNESPDDLTVVCNSCHSKFHGNTPGHNRSTIR